MSEDMDVFLLPGAASLCLFTSDVNIVQRDVLQAKNS